jgi:ligand-binding SRPBCC domain-containing protein
MQALTSHPDSTRIPFMREHLLERTQLVEAPRETVFPFFADALNLESITPPWLNFRVITPGPIEMGVGALIEYRLSLHRVPVRWLTRIEDWQPGRSFVDAQVRGPYRLWHHTHTFEDAPAGTLVRDRVRYALPLGVVGEVAHRAFVARDLHRIFDHRQSEIARRFTK